MGIDYMILCDIEQSLNVVMDKRCQNFSLLIAIYPKYILSNIGKEMVR